MAGLLLAVLLASVFFGGCRRPVVTYEGEGMVPSIPPGSRLQVDFRAYARVAPERFDIVLFEPPASAGLDEGRMLAFRVVGLPGETISIRGPHIHINAQRLTLPAGVAYTDIPPENLPVPRATLADDEFFLLGDNAEGAFDSRLYGPVPRENIIGKVTGVHPPKDRPSN